MAGHLGPIKDQPLLTAGSRRLAVEESALRAAVSERLGEVRFGRWFGDGVRLGLSGDGNALEVRVPDSFFREWIQSHYSTSLLEAAEAVVGRPVRLSIQIHDDAQPPSGNLAGTRPPRDEPNLQPQHQCRATSSVPDDSEGRLFCLDARAVEPGTSFARVPSQLSAGGCQSANRALPAPGANGSPRAGPPGRPPRRLEDFVTGPGNRIAHAAAREMAQSAGAAFNPLVIHGGVGLGKTHLLEGIGHALRQAHPARNVVQLTAEVFTNSFLEAMRGGNLSGFRARFRSAGGLIVDEVHFLAAKRATQDEFLHTFNALIDKGAPIILSADQHPRLISRLTDELITRFLGGMVVKIEAPDLATRRAILQAAAAARGVNVPEPVIAYMAEHLRTTIRELEGALHTVIAQAVLTGKRLDLNVAKAALIETIRYTVQTVAMRDVERAICQHFQISAEALRSESRARALAYPRMLAMYLARKHTGAAYSEIGRYYGGRNHSTVISAEKKVEKWLRDEESRAHLPGFESVADLLANLERALGA
jgi:chromosomal replication initiator protein